MEVRVHPFHDTRGIFMSALKQFDTTNFKKNWSTYIILGLALGAMLFFGVCNPQGYMHQLDNVAGSVDGEEITQAEFSRAYASESERARQRSGQSSSDLKIAGQVLDQLLSYRFLFLEAKQLGLVVTDEDIINYLTEVRAFRGKDGKFSNEVFHNFLRGNRYSEASFMEEMRRNLTVDKLRELLAEATYASNKSIEYDYILSESKMSVDYIKVDPEKIRFNVSPEDIKAFLAEKESEAKVKDYYDSHQSEYHSPEKVHARHILVSHKDARNASGDALKRSKEDAKKRAELILSQVKAPGADFVAIAKKETDEPSGKTKGGDLGYFAADAMVKEFAQASFALPVGGISPLVETQFGFHIIQSVDKKAPVNVTLEQAKNDIVIALIRKAKAPAMAKETSKNILSEYKAGKPVDALIKSVSAEWKTTDEFALNTSYIAGIGNNMKLIEAVFMLRNKDQIVDEPVEVQGSFYILKLHSRHVVDSKGLDAKKREQLAQSLSYKNGYYFLQKFEQSAREKFEKRKAIYRNPQYLALDTAKPE